MRKIATLLITHIHKIYTGKQISSSMITLTDGYIGIFHDEIIAVGVGSYSHLLDKDTRILDATGQIAIPGFIDCAYEVSLGKRDLHRRLHEQLMLGMQHGVTTMNLLLEEPTYVYAHYNYDMLWNHSVSPAYPCVKVEHILHHPQAYRRFCLSASHGSYDPLLSARLYYQKYHPSGIQLLKALSVYPAQSLKLHDRGVIACGKLADIVLVNATSLEELFSKFNEHTIHHVIKRGVRIFPNVIV